MISTIITIILVSLGDVTSTVIPILTTMGNHSNSMVMVVVVMMMINMVIVIATVMGLLLALTLAHAIRIVTLNQC